MVRVLGIDRMRGAAALTVLLAHQLGPRLPVELKYFLPAHPAVIAFFVISGFCIHHPYRSTNLPISAFLSARITRILVPTMIALALAQVVGYKNYNFVDGYILWSVVCELWYYALYPLFLATSRFVSWRIQWGVSMVLSLAVVGAMGIYPSAHGYGPLLDWVVYLPSWLLGCIIAEHLGNDFQRHAQWVFHWRAAALVLAAFSYWLLRNAGVGYELTSNVFAIAVAFWMRAEIAKGGSGWLDWIGIWSFSIYLLHMPMYRAAQQLMQLKGAWKLALIPVALALCYLGYRLIEKPAHQLARQMYKALRNIRPVVAAPQRPA